MANDVGLYTYAAEHSLKCTAKGFPVPNLHWIFRPCRNLTQCDKGHERALSSGQNATPWTHLL